MKKDLNKKDWSKKKNFIANPIQQQNSNNI
jgi:hypothetical protein